MEMKQGMPHFGLMDNKGQLRKEEGAAQGASSHPRRREDCAREDIAGLIHLYDAFLLPAVAYLASLKESAL
jgi:hypothetical protein